MNKELYFAHQDVTTFFGKDGKRVCNFITKRAMTVKTKARLGSFAPKKHYLFSELLEYSKIKSFKSCTSARMVEKITEIRTIILASLDGFKDYIEKTEVNDNV